MLENIISYTDFFSVLFHVSNSFSILYKDLILSLNLCICKTQAKTCQEMKAC